MHVCMCVCVCVHECVHVCCYPRKGRLSVCIITSADYIYYRAVLCPVLGGGGGVLKGEMRNAD